MVKGLGPADAYENGNGAWCLIQFRKLIGRMRKYYSSTDVGTGMELLRNEQHAKMHHRIVTYF